MQMPNSNLDHLWRAFIHDADSAAKTKDATQSDTFLNTATCWMKMNIENATETCGSAIEALQKAVGANLVNSADLMVLAGDAEVSSDAAINSILDLEDDDEQQLCYPDSNADVAAASQELRQHLLRACNLPAPTMCAAPPCAACLAVLLKRALVMYRCIPGLCLGILAHVACSTSTLMPPSLVTALGSLLVSCLAPFVQSSVRAHRGMVVAPTVHITGTGLCCGCCAGPKRRLRSSRSTTQHAVASTRKARGCQQSW